MRKYHRPVMAIIAALAILALGACAGPYDKYAEQPVKITILETTDVHGMITPMDFTKNAATEYSIAQFAGLVTEKRRSGELLLVDGGDSLQGQPIIYYNNFLKTGGTHIWSDVVNWLRYDVVTVGNHDIETGHPVYDKVFTQWRATVVCANILKSGTQEPYFTPYTVVNKGGIKIAILGMTEPGITTQLPAAFWSGMDIIDMVECAKRWVPIIQKTEKPDVIIGLFHSGLDYTYGGATADTQGNESGSQLVAQQVPGFDLILVGHDHKGWDGKGWDPVAKAKIDVKDPNGKIVPIFGGLDYVRSVPVIELTMAWDKKARTWNKTIVGSLVEMKGLPVNADFMTAFKPEVDEFVAWKNQVIGSMNGKISSDDALFGDAAFTDLIHRLQMEICADPANGLKPVQVSFVAPLSPTAVLPIDPSGKVTIADMFALYKYENYLYTMDLTGEQIRKFLEFSYGMWMDTMTKAGDHIIAFQKDPSGALIFDTRNNMTATKTNPYNYDSAAGIKYTVDITKPVGSRINITSMADGTPFSLTKTYSVAINSYRGSGGGDHLTKGVGLDPLALKQLKLVTSSTTKDLRYYFIKWFQKQTGPITPTRDDNWKVMPEDLAAAGKALDYPLVYPPQK
ncbi:MAG: bifunctional metallophosphatase/5'-nucleotidase [Spirochaetes bacterium]|nr:bifunctional metallophosphatase/5'-nucleotidase [Spirochaetota bacterium]